MAPAEVSGAVLERLKALSISGPDVSHVASTSAATWRDALSSASSNPSVPASYELTKTLVFKPKTAKTAKPVPVVVVARDVTETPSGPLQKRLAVKEMRLAGEELLDEFLGVGKDEVSPLAITSENAGSLQIVLDASLATSDALFAVKSSSAQRTVFLRGADIAKYLDSTGAKVDVVDFAELKKEAETPIAKVAAPSAKSASTSDPKAAASASAKIDGALLIGIDVRKDLDFANWYQQVLIKGDMLDYYDVSGCYILKPWSYSVWQSIQTWFDAEIKKLGVENAYFPMFVSSTVLEREKDHIEGFAPEVAWVTRAGSSDLKEPIAIRPTSETVMYPYYAKWIRSHRDLPLKLNQWNSVVRWEFKNPQPFLRTREFLWQEGHTAFLTKKEAEEEVLQILDLYRRVYEELLAVPVVPGVKSEKEKFAGGLYTTTVEGFVPTTGRAIQGGTSHCLGQNFSKMFNIAVEDPDSKTNEGEALNKLHVWQNSWGLSTRTIGVMVMVHGDDKGLVLPPRVAQVQVVIVPCGINTKLSRADKDKLLDECDALAKKLKHAGVRAKADLREGCTSGFKFNDWELRGVPIRLELGPADLKKSQTIAVRRDDGTKTPIPLANITNDVTSLLDKVHKDMYDRANKTYTEHRKVTTEWNEFVGHLNNKNVVVIPWCEREECEDDIKERSARSAATDEPVDERAPSAGAKSLCIPFDQAQFPALAQDAKCAACGLKPKRWTMFGRSY